MNKFIGAVAALVFFSYLPTLPQSAYSDCTEVSLSTCIGDFAEGGDIETGDRLIGNTSFYGFGIIQDNKVRIWVSSGHFWVTSSTPFNAGFVGIHTDGITQTPKFHMDVWGVLRATGALIVGTTQPTLNHSTNYFFLVQNGTTTILKNGNVGLGTVNPTAKFYVDGGSVVVAGSGAALEVAGQIWSSNGGIKFPDNTIQTSAASGSGGGGQKVCNITAGKPGSGADIIVNDSDSFNSIFSSVGLRGLTTNTSIQVNICIGSGTYDITDTTVPAGAELWMVPGSSTVFRPGGSLTKSMMTVYGKLHNPMYDAQGIAYTSQMVQVGTGAEINNAYVYGAHNANQGTNDSTFFMFNFSSGARISGTAAQIAAAVQDNQRGGLATFLDARNCMSNFKSKEISYGAAGRQVYFLARSTGITIDGDYEQAGGRFIFVYGGNRDLRIRGDYHISKAYGAAGFIFFRSLEFSISSGTIIENLNLHHDVSQTAPLIGFQGETTEYPTMTTIRNCFARTTQASVPTAFVNLGTGNIPVTVLYSNSVLGMPFLTDTGGLGTKYTTNDNFRDGVEQ